MHECLAEKAQYLDALARRLVEQSNTFIKDEREAGRGSRFFSIGKDRPSRNPLGDDLDADDLAAIENVHNGRLAGIDSYREAQLRELAFWRWVAFNGYGGKDPRLFPSSQELLMVGTFYRTGWTLSEFATANVIELGCGPLGMIEYVPAARRIAFDPLNSYYSRLFSRHRTPGITYISTRSELESQPRDFDLAICHNVIDHTDEPAYWFNELFAHLKQGARFIFQVNLSRRGVPQPEEHRRMHPAPFVDEQIREWLQAKSDDFEFQTRDTPTADGEFYSFAYGRNTSDRPVTYVKPEV